MTAPEFNASTQHTASIRTGLALNIARDKDLLLTFDMTTNSVKCCCCYVFRFVSNEI